MQPDQDTNNSNSAGVGNNSNSSDVGIDGGEDLQTTASDYELPPDEGDDQGRSDSPGQNRGGHAGRKTVKNERKIEHLVMQNALTGASIAKSLERKAILYEDKNAMRAV